MSRSFKPGRIILHIFNKSRFCPFSSYCTVSPKRQRQREIEISKSINVNFKSGTSSRGLSSQVKMLTIFRPPEWSFPSLEDESNDFVENLVNKTTINDYTSRSHTCGELTCAHLGQRVTLYGWLAFKRLRGMFFVLRDTYGVTQAILPHDTELKGEIERAPLDSVIQISGIVAFRPEKQQRTDIVSGAIEIQVDQLKVISKPDKMRLSNREYGKVEEEIRMEYRYLDLRSDILQKRLKFRARLINRMRHFMNANHFVDIETPTLLRRTPGGAREYPVATHHKNLFYSLAQSPQILKQLLMVGGMDRYYQVARCYRDEKSRPDRQPEFTQLDIELSFTTREQVMKLIENLLRYSINIPADEKFKVMSYNTAISEYGCDKPDTGGFVWIVDFPLFCKAANGYAFEASHHPFTMPTSEEVVYEDPLKAIGLSYDLVYRGSEIGGGSIRIHDSKLQKYIYEDILRLPSEDIGYLLEALDSGCPPHGGFAIGLDRLVAMLTGAKTIREVIAFPKTSDGKDLLSKAPSPLTDNDKSYYHLK